MRTVTGEQFIADTLPVTDYLRNRFGKEKIYLMAHSGGTFIGLQSAARAPEAYHAYIGVAQMVHQLASERWNEMLATDLADRVPALAVPAYFFHGVHDYTVSYQLAKDYHDRLAAPLKGFYTFERSAHSPVMEEPQKARRIMREDVLAGTSSRADDSRRAGEEPPGHA